MHRGQAHGRRLAGFEDDALISPACREQGIPAIASFDADFDQVPWLRRLARPEDVTS